MRDPEASGSRTIVGVAAILLLAGALVAAPRGGDVVDVVSAALQAAFLAVLAAAGWRLYRSQSNWFADLTDRNRGFLFGATALALLTIVGRGRFDQIGGGGALLWLAVLAGCGLTVFWVWRESRRFSY